MMDKGQNVTHQGQRPSECEKRAGSLETLGAIRAPYSTKEEQFKFSSDRNVC
jgi:hypothetical protein